MRCRERLVVQGSRSESRSDAEGALDNEKRHRTIRPAPTPQHPAEVGKTQHPPTRPNAQLAVRNAELAGWSAELAGWNAGLAVCGGD